MTVVAALFALAWLIASVAGILSHRELTRSNRGLRQVIREREAMVEAALAAAYNQGVAVGRVFGGTASIVNLGESTMREKSN